MSESAVNDNEENRDDGHAPHRVKEDFRKHTRRKLGRAPARHGTAQIHKQLGPMADSYIRNIKAPGFRRHSLTPRTSTLSSVLAAFVPQLFPGQPAQSRAF